MIIKVNSKKFHAAVNKISRTAKESVLLRFRNLQDGSVGVQIIATDGFAQSQIGVMVEIDEKVENDYTIVLPGDFIGTIKGINSLGDKIEIKVNETHSVISCGTAVITLPLLKNGKEIAVCSPEKEKFVAFMTTRDEFKKALLKGALASDNGTGKGVFDNTLFLNFSQVDDQYKLLMITVGGEAAFVSAKYASIQVPAQCEEMINTMVKEEKTVYVTASHFLGMLEHVSEQISVYVFDKQTVVCSGADTYVFVNKVGNFNIKVLKKLLFKNEYTFNIKVDNAELKKALSVATLNVIDDKNKIVMELNKELKISSVAGSSTITVPVKEGSEGEIRIGLNASFLKRAIERCENEVEIFGTEEKKPIYVRDNDNEADIVILPTKLD